MASYRICMALAWAAWLPATVALATGEPPKVALKPAEPEAANAAPPSTTVAPVTVESTKPEELKKQAYSFVQTYAQTTQNLDQLARWDIPVCVSVQGLPADASAQVKARVEEVAKALKVRVQPKGCKANIQVFFTDQPQALMDRVAVEHEEMLGYWHRTDRDKLKTVTHPIQAWYVTATNGSGGNTAGMTFAFNGSGGTGAAPTMGPRGTSGRQQQGETYDDEDTLRMPTGCGDRPAFTSCLASVFRNVLVVVDTGKVKAQTPGAVADYVSLLAMAQPRSLDACNTLPSVIDMFAKACGGRDGSDGLSRADVAYLTALYKTDLEAKKTGQETDIAAKMADMLLKADASGRLAAWGGGPVKTSNTR
jgi:hypothetical protein